MRVVVAALVTTLSASAALANQSLERAMTLLFDYNDDGTLSPTELTDMQEEIERIKNRVASERQQIADRKRDEFKPQLWKTGFLVRDVYQTGAFLDESYVEGDGGARLTFVNDFATGAAALTASGSLMYGAFGEVNRLTNPVYLGFLGGVDFNTRWAGGKNLRAGWRPMPVSRPAAISAQAATFNISRETSSTRRTSKRRPASSTSRRGGCRSYPRSA